MDVTELEESFTFIQKTPVVFPTEQKLSHARDLLLNRIFLGYYEERRYVAELNEYRDIVKLSSAESELKTDFDGIIKELKGISGIKWLGITGGENECSKPGSCLWVKLKNLPFGSFWFQIKQIKYENGEIILGLKCVRQVRPQDYVDTVEDTIPESENLNNSEVLAEYSFASVILQAKKMVCAGVNNTLQQVKPHLTWNNFFLISKMIFSLVFVLTSTFLTNIGNIGEYFLKLLREVGFLLQVITPVFLCLIESITKIIGGIFVLAALIFRGRSEQQPLNQFSQRLMPPTATMYELNQLIKDREIRA